MNTVAPPHPAAADHRRRSRWQTPALTWSVSLAVHAVMLLVLGSIIYAVVDAEPERDTVIQLTPIEPVEPVPVPQTGTAGGGAPSMQEVADATRSDAVAAPLPAPPLPADTGAAPLPADSSLSLDPAAVDPAMAVLADLADAPTAAQPVGVGANPLLRGVDAGTLDGLGRMGRQGLDVVFVLDATGSMEDSIRQAKQRIRDVHAVVTGMLDAADAQSEQADPEQDEPPPARRVNRRRAPLPAVRFGVVAFKDYGDDYGIKPTRHLPLTGDAEELHAFIDRVFVGGGGPDLAEPIDRALVVAADADDMGWQRGRHSVIVLVTDAPVHPTGRRRAFNTAERFANRLDGTINVIDTDPDRQHVLEDLGNIAVAGNGSAFRLEDRDRFWRHLVVSIFPQRFEHDVNLIVERYATDN